MLLCPYCHAHCSEEERSDHRPILYGCPGCLNLYLLEDDGRHAVGKPLREYRPFDEMAQPGSVMAGVLGCLGEALETLPMLPDAPQRVMVTANDPLSAMSDVAAVVSGDTALSVRVLRMANSAWYGGVDAISDLTTATARIGMRGIVNLALASAQANLYRTSRPEWQGFMEGLWRHSIASAHAADLLGRQGLDRSEHSPFVAALVHDIGKVVLFDLITAKYRGSVGRLGEDPVLLARVLDHFHRLVGVHAVQRWQMPLEYRCSTWHAVAPDEAPEYARRLAHTVALADAVANACGYAAFRPEPVNLGSHPSARFFMISRLTLDEICVRLNEELDTLLEMVGKP